MVLPPVSEKKFTEGYPKMKICVTGAGGFIASHLSKRLKAEGHTIRAVDWKENEYMKQEDFCDEFINLDLRWPENCKKAVEGCDWCFNLAVRAQPAFAAYPAQLPSPLGCAPALQRPRAVAQARRVAACPLRALHRPIRTRLSSRPKTSKHAALLPSLAGGHGRHGLHPVQPLAHPVQLHDDQLQRAP